MRSLGRWIFLAALIGVVILLGQFMVQNSGSLKTFLLPPDDTPAPMNTEASRDISTTTPTSTSSESVEE